MHMRHRELATDLETNDGELTGTHARLQVRHAHILAQQVGPAHIAHPYHVTRTHR